MSKSQAIEDYAKAVYVLGIDRDGLVPSGEVATRLGVTPATATAMLQKLAELGLADYTPYKGVALTEAQIFTQPNAAIGAWKAYGLGKFETPVAATNTPRWTIVPQPTGIGFAAVF